MGGQTRIGHLRSGPFRHAPGAQVANRLYRSATSDRITPARGVYKYAKIQQIAVRNDARRLYYGKALIDVCRQFCEKFGRIGFTLRCRVDLDSNKFWKSLGFEKYDTWEKGKINHVGFKASNDINLWKIELNRYLPQLKL